MKAAISVGIALVLVVVGATASSYNFGFRYGVSFVAWNHHTGKGGEKPAIFSFLVFVCLLCSDLRTTTSLFIASDPIGVNTRGIVWVRACCDLSRSEAEFGLNQFWIPLSPPPFFSRPRLVQVATANGSCGEPRRLASPETTPPRRLTFSSGGAPWEVWEGVLGMGGAIDGR